MKRHFLTSKIPIISLLILIFMALSPPKHSLACSPAPGSTPASLSQKVDAAPYVFEGKVTDVTEAIATVQVIQYYKGSGPPQVKIEGFNMTSCDDFINISDHRIFFGSGDVRDTLTAVYDGAFGSVQAASSKIIGEIAAHTQSGTPSETTTDTPNTNAEPETQAETDIQNGTLSPAETLIVAARAIATAFIIFLVMFLIIWKLGPKAEKAK